MIVSCALFFAQHHGLRICGLDCIQIIKFTLIRSLEDKQLLELSSLLDVIWVYQVNSSFIFEKKGERKKKENG